MSFSRRAWLSLTTAAASASLVGCSRPRFMLLNWSDYLAPEVITRFEQKNGVKLSQDIFGAEAQMAAKLAAGAAFHAAMTIDYHLSVLHKDGLLTQLDPLPAGVENLDPAFPPWEARAERGGGTFAIPYLWGTTGIAYDAEKIPKVDSWKALFNPEYAGRISVLDSKGDVMDQALLAAGLDINAHDAAEIDAKIRPLLFEQKKLLRAYDPDPARALVAGETWIAQIDSGDALRAAERRPSLTYVVPKEGAARWCDYVVIPKTCPDVELARRFLEHLLDPEIAALNANALRFATPNAKARSLGLIDDANDPMVYPSAETAAKLSDSEYWDGSVDTTVRTIWQDLRAG